MLARLPANVRWFKWQGYHRTWTVYRYGARPAPKPSPIFRGQRRENAIDGVIATLSRFHLTPFEHEASCRNGIRSKLCLDGHSWRAADDAAADVVREALRRMGAERPTWDAGQWHHTIPREQCARCGGDIDDADQAKGFRHCSPECARAHKQSLSDQVSAHHPLALAAYWQVYLAGAPAFTCEQCGKSFKTRQWNNAAPRYCGKACHDASMKSPPRPCTRCGASFVPGRASQRFCSGTCASAEKEAAFRDSAAPRTCRVCGERFQPTGRRSVYCSPQCRREHENARQRDTYNPAAAREKYLRKKAKLSSESELTISSPASAS